MEQCYANNLFDSFFEDIQRYFFIHYNSENQKLIKDIVHTLDEIGKLEINDNYYKECNTIIKNLICKKDKCNDCHLRSIIYVILVTFRVMTYHHYMNTIFTVFDTSNILIEDLQLEILDYFDIYDSDFDKEFEKELWKNFMPKSVYGQYKINLHDIIVGDFSNISEYSTLNINWRNLLIFQFSIFVAKEIKK